jgi:hypothetical protein
MRLGIRSLGHQQGAMRSWLKVDIEVHAVPTD